MASFDPAHRQVRFFDDLVRCETRLYNAVGERLRTDHGIATAQFELLRFVRDRPGSRVVDVATNFAAGIGAISKLVDRLEDRGWVVRLPNPADGRSALIALTADGEGLLTRAEGTFRDRLAELLAPALQGDGGDTAATALATLRRALESARVGVPAG
jgi:DNA-binding MarR family transcriptional regulator